MFTRNKFVVTLLLYLVLLHQTECNKDRVAKHEEKDRHSKSHDDVEFAHKLENAPIPSIHDGPKLFLLRSRSVIDFLHLRAKRHISQAVSLNPQKPHQRNEVPHQEVTENNSGTNAPLHFHHPGHSSQLNRNYPTNTYNYYNVANTYGSAFQYGGNHSFKGYAETANIGVVLPRGANIKNYYNSFRNLSQYPIVGQHSNSLYENRGYPIYEYGYGGRGYAKNAYKNVLTGLAVWNILNGLVNGVRYTVYNYTNLPDEYPRDIVLSNDTIVPCFEDAALFCNNHAQPLCINNGTTFCVSSAMVPCDDEALVKACVDISVPCDNCEDNQTTYLPCAANITILAGSLDKEKFNNTLDFSESSQNKNVVLCATSLVIPQKSNVSRPSCDGKLSCLENPKQNEAKSIIENTTKPDERKTRI